MSNEVLKNLGEYSLKDEYKKIEEKGEALKSIFMDKQYKYNLSFAEKVDRLNICQSKECYSGTDKYAQEIQDILHDIQVDLDNGVVVTAEMIRAIVVLTQSNLAIWLGEDDIRKGQSTKTDKEKADALTQTHLLNGTRSISKSWIQNLIGGRIDEKINCLAANSAWKISVKKEEGENEQWRYM